MDGDVAQEINRAVMGCKLEALVSEKYLTYMSSWLTVNDSLPTK